MAVFKFKKCPRIHATPIFKAAALPAGQAGQAGTAALQRLRSFLNAEEPQAVEFLVSLWGEQRSAITYKELREAVLSGDLSAAQLDLWRLGYSRLVNEQLAPQWEKAMLAAAEELQRQYPHFLYNPQSQSAQEYIRLHGASLVTNIVEEQRSALRSAVLHALKLDNSMTAEDLSRMLRPMIGLTKPQAMANTNHYNAVRLSALESGMSLGAAKKKASESAVRYAHRQERYRAMTIARTELASAYNQGAYLATLDAQEKGYIGDCRKIWLTAADELVCDICAGLDGKPVNLKGKFKISVKGKFKGAIDLPPAHPRCRCAVAYEEI
jgi:hypothetical protein